MKRNIGDLQKNPQFLLTPHAPPSVPRWRLISKVDTGGLRKRAEIKGLQVIFLSPLSVSQSLAPLIR